MGPKLETVRFDQFCFSLFLFLYLYLMYQIVRKKRVEIRLQGQDANRPGTANEESVRPSPFGSKVPRNGDTIVTLLR